MQGGSPLIRRNRLTTYNGETTPQPPHECQGEPRRITSGNLIAQIVNTITSGDRAADSDPIGLLCMGLFFKKFLPSL
jgi:hypothetical protein